MNWHTNLTKHLLLLTILTSCGATPPISYIESELKTIIDLHSLHKLNTIVILTQTIPITISSSSEQDKICITTKCDSSVNKEKLPKLKVKSFNTQLTIALEGCTIKNRSGLKKIKELEVVLPESFMKHLKVKSRSGNINAQNLRLEKLNINTTSGSIELLNTTITNILSLKSTSGTKRVKGSSAHKLIVRSTSGDLESSCIAKNANIKSTKGNVKMYLLQKNNEHTSITTTKGNIELFVPANCAMCVKTNTLSGNINSIKYTHVKNCSKRVSIKTTSGNINILSTVIRKCTKSGNEKMYHFYN